MFDTEWFIRTGTILFGLPDFEIAVSQLCI